MGYINDELDEFIAMIPEFTFSPEMRNKYNHLHRLIRSQDKALRTAMQENAAHFAELELLRESNKRGSDELERLRKLL